MNRYFYMLLFACMLFSSCQTEPLEKIENPIEVIDKDISNLPLSANDKTSVEDPIINWVFQMQASSGLLTSTENSDFTSLYDNALAALLFIEEDKKEKAELILDYFTSQMNTELAQHGGFYQFRKSDGSEPENIWMGDNAWLLIAINHYAAAYGSTKYDSMAKKLEFWLRSLQQPDGSLIGGFNADGTEKPKVTEGMLTAFNAVKGYDSFHKNLLSYLANDRWSYDQNSLMAWPENPDYAFALDVLALSKNIFPDMPNEVLFQANRFLNEQILTISGEPITGYCFDDDKDVIWLEGSAQMATAFNSIERYDLADKLLLDLKKSVLSSTKLSNAEGLPYTSNYGSSYGTSLLWNHTDILPTLSSTIWYVFAKKQFNPLQLGRKTKIPEEDKFWKLKTNG